jgi:ABC-2 type transport system permease protein
MKKYFRIVKIALDEAVAYRVSFLMWRFRIIFHVLALYFLWFAVLPRGTDEFLGYTQTSMVTYIFVVILVSALVTPTRSYAIGDDIISGNLSNLLLKPINYFLYWLARDAGSVLIDVLFSMGELALLFFLLRPPFFMQKDLVYLLLFFLSIVLSFMLYFFFNLLLGFIGFWSSDVWAPRFVFYTAISFLAGGYFPLDVLPSPLFTFFHLLPFGNLLYFPAKVYLGQLPVQAVLSGLFTSGLWVLCLYLIAYFVWKRGLRLYTAYGR